MKKLPISAITDLVAPLVERGWKAFVRLDACGAELCWLTGGDPNCPHPKNFDPADGHGYTHLHCDEYDSEEDCEEWRWRLASATWMCQRAAELEGQRRKRHYGPRLIGKEDANG